MGAHCLEHGGGNPRVTSESEAGINEFRPPSQSPSTPGQETNRATFQALALTWEPSVRGEVGPLALPSPLLPPLSTSATSACVCLSAYPSLPQPGPQEGRDPYKVGTQPTNQRSPKESGLVIDEQLSP